MAVFAGGKGKLKGIGYQSEDKSRGVKGEEKRNSGKQ